jgi:hypothetical protein
LQPIRLPASDSIVSKPLSRRTKKQRCLKARCGKIGIPTKLVSPFASREICRLNESSPASIVASLNVRSSAPGVSRSRFNLMRSATTSPHASGARKS